MDIKLLKTFLEVVKERHFGKAAENLFITTSAVSARIKQLEESMAIKLFVRGRNNIHLTSEGERLLVHARSLVNSWDKIRYELKLATNEQQQLSILAEDSFWHTFLPEKIQQIKKINPGISLKLESMSSESIWRRLQQNKADVGFVLEPLVGPELEIKPFTTLNLQLVSRRPNQSAKAIVNQDNYVMVDWGVSFVSRHNALYPEVIANTNCSNATTAMAILKQQRSGACYLPQEMAGDLFRSEIIYPVEDALNIALPVYIVYPVWSLQLDLINTIFGEN